MAFMSDHLLLQDYLMSAMSYGAEPNKEIKHVYRYTFTMPEYADATVDRGFRSSSYYSPAILEYAKNGWREHEAEAMDVCDRAVRMVETEMQTFQPVNAVSGEAVDIGAAIAGLPEDMVHFPLQTERQFGNVIELVADVQCLGVVSDAAVLRRGLVIAGLAMALNRLGYQTTYWISDEYWHSSRPDEKIIIRVLVKGPNDFIDPSRILFAYAHPGVQRSLGFAFTEKEKGDPKLNHHGQTYGTSLGNHGHGVVTSTTQDLGPDCIYLPPLRRDSDSPNADAEIRRYLMQLGLIPDDDEA